MSGSLEKPFKYSYILKMGDFFCFIFDVMTYVVKY